MVCKFDLRILTKSLFIYRNLIIFTYCNSFTNRPVKDLLPLWLKLIAKLLRESKSKNLKTFCINFQNANEASKQQTRKRRKMKRRKMKRRKMMKRQREMKCKRYTHEIKTILYNNNLNIFLSLNINIFKL